ncbi:hypothetical protein EXN66_Car015355 [Channa argus]|uniref:C2H2-type domain-containing protein n=1 Tax=Channa argus TaxID=215402 RepID=A0A6G1QBM1_CHAAH|nr:hypothetical protein EXN66_Car015355 [Channa argus]
MNGPVYISFFQGQLESVLEQVVQLAVQEISKTVGSSLNALLLETAVKEQENHRLTLQLQSRENRDRASSDPSDGGGSPVSGKNKAVKAAGDERADSSRTKPEQHAPGGQGMEPGLPTDTRRLEQRRRLVDQLKSVMEQVLDFAVRELTKIVEASFDDLLLEITKMEREHQLLQDRLGKSSERTGGVVEEKGRGGAGVRRRGSENDSVSPSGSEDAREDHTEVTVPKTKTEADDNSGHRSSASMLHRLLTLPSQLLEEDDEDAAAKETLAALAIDGINNSQDSIEQPGQTCPSPLTTREEEEDEEEEEEEEDKGRKKKRRRVWSECEECGRRFSRMSLLKAHRQTHIAENIITDTSSPSSPSGSTGSALRCSECGKRFSSATRLHSHIRTQHHGNWDLTQRDT